MDLILLQPGDSYFAPTYGNVTNYNVPDPDGIPGFSFAQCIPLISAQQDVGQLSMDISQPGTGGKPNFSEFICVKQISKVSPRFFEYCAQAKPLGVGKDQPTYIHFFTTVDDGSTGIFSVALRDARVSGIQIQAGPAGSMSEQFKLSFTEITWTYQLKIGTAPAEHVFAGWSTLINGPIAQFTD